MPSEIGVNDIPTNVLPKISVFGVGGAGINAINNMILSQLDNVKFVVANTDCQSLMNSLAETKIQLGAKCTKGLGAGSNPEVGRQAAEEASEAIKRELAGIDMLFIATGMGGGTGTGASPVIAKMAKDMGILTIAIAIKPFLLEGKRRMETANEGVANLEQIVDTLIVIENQKLMEMNNVSMFENYAIADGILRQAVYCVVSILIKQGFINRDFADIKTVLSSAGRAVIGYGEDVDPRIATDLAIHNQVLENNSIKGAKNILLNISGNRNLKPADIEDVVNKVRDEAKVSANDEPNIIFGIVFDEELGNNTRVSVIAAGVECSQSEPNNNNEEQNEPSEHVITNQNEQQEIEVKKIDDPVFSRPLDEDDLENDESFNLMAEDIPHPNDSTDLFQNEFFQTSEEKKKMNKTNSSTMNTTGEHLQKSAKHNFNSKSGEQPDLFNEDKKGQKKHENFSLLSKIMNSKIVKSIGNIPEIETIDNEKTFSSNDEKEDLYNVSAIRRKAG